MYTPTTPTYLEDPVELLPTEVVPIEEELPEAPVEVSVEAPVGEQEASLKEAEVSLKEVDGSAEFQLVDITDHPTHGNFTIEVPKSFKTIDMMEYIDKLDLNLMLGIGRSKLKGDDMDRIKAFENNIGSGFKNDKWTPVKSLEGGTNTLAYGHKLTAKEVESGMLMIGGVEVAYANGITDKQATTLFNQDAEWAKGYAEDSLNKSGLELNANRVQALTSLIFNVGNGAWGKSKAKEFLEAGNIEDFMHEAFDPEVGFVKINGEVSRGLVRRRGEEATLFGESDIAEGGGLGTMMSDVLSRINPISEAAAGTLPPTEEATPQTLLKRNSKDTESVGKLQDMLGMDVGKDRGIFGPATEAAVKVFQKEQGLPADGIVGKDTFAALQGSESEVNKPQDSGLSVIKTIEDNAKTFWKDFTKVTPGMQGIDKLPSSYKVYGNYIQGYTGIITEKILNKEEKGKLTDVVLNKIKKGSNFLTYKDYGGVQDAGYDANISFSPELGDTLKFTLGKADIIKQGSTILVADEYDLPFDPAVLANFKYEVFDKDNNPLLGGGKKKVGITPKELHNASLAIKLEYISQADGSQGKAHRYGELFGAKEGKGLSQRYVIGTVSSLGLSEEDVSQLMTIEEYEKLKLSTNKMNPANSIKAQ